MKPSQHISNAIEYIIVGDGGNHSNTPTGFAGAMASLFFRGLFFLPVWLPLFLLGRLLRLVRL